MTMRFHSVADLEAFQKQMGVGSRQPVRRANEEHQHQVAVIQWRDLLSRQYPALSRLHAIPNGGARNRAEAANLKAEGVTAGVPDLFGPHAAHDCHGIYLELKTPSRQKERRGGLTVEQMAFLKGVAAEGFFAAVAYGSNGAIEVLEWYYGISPLMPKLGSMRRIFDHTFECLICGGLSEESYAIVGSKQEIFQVSGIKQFCSNDCRESWLSCDPT